MDYIQRQFLALNWILAWIDCDWQKVGLNVTSENVCYLLKGEKVETQYEMVIWKL